MENFSCKQIKETCLESAHVVYCVPKGKQVMLKTLQGVVIDSSTFVPMNSAIVDKNCFVYGIGPEGTGREDTFECNVVMDEGDKLAAVVRVPVEEENGDDTTPSGAADSETPSSEANTPTDTLPQADATDVDENDAPDGDTGE